MDPRRFDDLTRRLSTPTSRRSVLKGLAGAALGGLLAQLPVEDATAAPKPKKPKKCLPEGKKSKDPSRCCSLKTSNGVCCSEEYGSCAVSGCCGVATTPFCYDGFCVDCLPKGARTSDSANCCSKTSVNGVCCGDGVEYCISGCCSGETPFCHDDKCVNCLPEGAPATDPHDCCYNTRGNGMCCAGLSASCARSGCCSSNNEFCHNGLCVSCLPEGTPSSDPAKCCGGAVQDGVCHAEGCLPPGAATTDPSLCCSLLSHLGVCVQCYPEGTTSDEPLECCSEAVNADQICCGKLGGSCVVGGCCEPGFTCCKGVCAPDCPSPMALNPETCLCELSCSPLASACTEDTECCSGSCCNGVCVDTQSDTTNCGSCGRRCPICHDGICGTSCDGVFCPPDSLCLGGTCCPYCPPGKYAIPYNCGDGVCCCSPYHYPVCDDGGICPFQ